MTLIPNKSLLLLLLLFPRKKKRGKNLFWCTWSEDQARLRRVASQRRAQQEITMQERRLQSFFTFFFAWSARQTTKPTEKTTRTASCHSPWQSEVCIPQSWPSVLAGRLESGRRERGESVVIWRFVGIFFGGGGDPRDGDVSMKTLTWTGPRERERALFGW